MFVPQDVEGIKHRLEAAEQQVAELRLTVGVEADDFAIEDTATTLQVTHQSLAQPRKRFEYVHIAGDEPHAVFVGVEQRPEAVPLDLKKPICTHPVYPQSWPVSQ